jgi:hypothetical protein
MAYTADCWTEDTVCVDLARVLDESFSRGTRILLANAAIWWWTERHGKYKGCPFWSLCALESLATQGTAGVSTRLRHEHVVPTPAQVHNVLSAHCIGCVVLREEASKLDRIAKQKMPVEFSTPGHALWGDPWARYRLAEVVWRGPLKWSGWTVSD